MAMIFTRKLSDGRKTPQWYNTIEADFMNCAPNNIEMLTDIVLTHSRVDFLLSRIIIGLFYYGKLQLIYSEIDSFAEILSKEITFMQKVKLVDELTRDKRADVIKDLPRDLKKMASIRNQIAHSDITYKLISEKFSKDIAIALKKEISIEKIPSKTLIIKPFKDYGKYYEKYFDFFSANIEYQIKALMGEENE